jgi:hypothetical protein
VSLHFSDFLHQYWFVLGGKCFHANERWKHVEKLTNTKSVTLKTFDKFEIHAKEFPTIPKAVNQVV